MHESWRESHVQLASLSASPSQGGSRAPGKKQRFEFGPQSNQAFEREQVDGREAHDAKDRVV